MLLLPIAVIALCYGGGFGTMPAFTADVFGPKNSGPIYGAMLTAWSAGAIIGPLLIASVPHRFCTAADSRIAGGGGRSSVWLRFLYWAPIWCARPDKVID